MLLIWKHKRIGFRQPKTKQNKTNDKKKRESWLKEVPREDRRGDNERNNVIKIFQTEEG